MQNVGTEDQLLPLLQLWLQEQNFRHVSFDCPHLHLVHFELTDLHLQVLVTWAIRCALVEMHQEIESCGLLGLRCQPHSNFEGMSFGYKVLPKTQPAWKELLNMCCSNASFDGGSFRKFSETEVENKEYLTFSKEVFSDDGRYILETKRSDMS